MNDPALPSLGSLPTSVATRLQLACRHFGASWHAGQRPRIEDYLREAAEAEKPLLFRDLLASELGLRACAGEKPAPEDYRERFPDYGDLIAAVFSSAESDVDKVDAGPQVKAAKEASHRIAWVAIASRESWALAASAWSTEATTTSCAATWP